MNFLASFLQALKPRYDDDVVDRLNYYYTCLIILLLSITISAKQYVGQPIQCWVPAQFTGAWEQYAENYCFVQNTYWMPLTDYIPKDESIRDDREIGYYQWVPFILALEALLFYIPCVIWRVLNFQSEIDVQSVVKMAADSANVSSEKREATVKTISRHIEDAIDLQREFGLTASIFDILTSCGRSQGVYISVLYIFVKILYVINAVGQFFLLNAFLGMGQGLWGLQILSNLYRNFAWEESGHFPRVTLCDFQVKVIGNLHSYTIQCVLMINMFNEKIFLFLWWWFLLVAVTSVVSLITWVISFAPSSKRTAFVFKYLRLGNPEFGKTKNEQRAVSKFVNLGLRPDGVFMLRLIALNAGDIITDETVHELWRLFKERHPLDLPKLDGTLKRPFLMDPPSKRASLIKMPLLDSNRSMEEGFAEGHYTPPNATPPSMREPTAV